MVSFKDKSLQKGPACRQAGQTLLIVVLIMVVSLTIGLSIASKTITNLRTTTEEADSAKALSAAETGVAQSIKSGGNVTGSFSPTLSFNTSIAIVSGTTLLVNGGNVIPQDEGADVWLIPHNSSGSLDFSQGSWNGTSLTIYWGDGSGGCNNAALEIITITGTQLNPVSNRGAFDPCSTRSLANKFQSVVQSVNTVSGKTFYYTANISVTSGLLVRIIPLYTNIVLAVSGGLNALPSQGSIISSSGKSGNVERKISVVANYASLPSEFFSYGLFVPK